MTKSTTAAGTTGPGGKLPPGRHGLSTEAVHEHQRQRLISAIAAVCVSPGYAAASIADIVKAAGVSRNTFYDFFESKEQCPLAAFDDYHREFCAALDRACAGATAPAQKVRLAVHAALAFFAADLPGTQLLTGGVLALGRPGAERYHAALDELAARIRAPAPALRRPDPAWSAVVIAATALDRAAISGDSGAVFALEDQLSELFLAAYSPGGDSRPRVG